MDKKIKVSACIIAYNIEKFIAGAIEGALSQELDCPYEIVISEDCSTDRTREIILDYQKKHPEKIRVILNEKNLGIWKNFANVISACQGEYIALCDGDDYWTDQQKLQIQINELEKHPECDMSFHPTIIKYMNGSRADHMKAYYGNNIKIFDTKMAILIGGSFCPTSSLFCHKSVFNEVLKFTVKFSLDLGGDNDDFMQIFGSLKGGLLYIPQCMSVYRFEGSGSWSEKYKNFEYVINHTQKKIAMFEKLDGYLDYKYSKEIKYKITLTNYTIWRKFIRLNKKECDNYENMRKQVYSLKMDKKILVKIIISSIANKIKKLLKFISGFFHLNS